MPLLIKSLDPFSPEARTVECIPKNRRIAAMCPKTDRPVVCIYNGRPLLRAGWKRKVKHGDVVAFVAMPRGSGGGNVLRMVAMVAIAVAAPYAAAAMMGTTVAAMGIAGSMLAAGLTIAGTMLVNAILPPPKPPTPQAAAEMAAPSPTYNLAAQGNAARLEQPIPVHYGRHLAYLDFAARPYQEYRDNEQFLYQLFVVGQGHYDIEDIRIEDTPIQNFDDVETEIVTPGNKVTLFPSMVIQSTEIGGAEIEGSQGPFVASGPGEYATKIGVDLVCPGGLYYSNDKGGMDQLSLTVKIEARKIDNNGDPAGSWTTLGTPTITGKTNTAIRKSYRYNVSSGRYEVRVTRTDTKDTRARAVHAVHWAGLRAYLPDDNEYGDITLLAVKLRATAQLSEQATRKINVIATRKLPKWHPTSGWSAPVATRSIAWALADICRASYGASLADDRYDLAGLYALDAIWAARGDKFDARFDGKMTVGEALTNTARAGRAKWYQQAGVVRFWRDGQQTVPQYQFQPRNIKAGSFSMEFAPAVTDTSDGARLTYFDERYWEQREAICKLSGSAGAKLSEINAFGMVQRAQVVREGMYIAAANRYRRRFVHFDTELDGHLIRFGDLVSIIHDVPKWGQSGDVVGWVSSTRTATLSEPPAWASSGNHYVRFVRDNGTPTGLIQVSKHATDPYKVILATSPGFTPETAGYTRERTRYAFGPAGQIEVQALITAVRPKGRTEISVEAVVEDSRVHDAESGTIDDDAKVGYPRVPKAPTVTGLAVTERGTPDAPQQIITWRSAAGADHYLVEYTTDDINWVEAGDTTGTRFVLSDIDAGEYFNVRVAGLGLLRGAWAYYSGTSGGKVARPGGIVDLSLVAPFRGTSCSIQWSAVPRANRYRVRVYAGGVLRRETTITGTRYTYSVSDAKNDGGPWRSFEFRVLPLGIVAGDTEATISASNPNIGQLNNVEIVGTPLGIQWSADAPTDADLSRYLVWASTTPGFTANSSTLVYAGTGNVAIIKLKPNKTYYVRCAAHDVWGMDSLNISGQFQVQTGTIDFAEVAGKIESPQLAASLLAPIQQIPVIKGEMDWDALTAKINRLGGVTLVKSERVHAFASVSAETAERVSSTTALAQQIETVQAGVAGNVAAIQTEQTARTTAIGAISAKWSVKAQTLGDGKKAVAGIEVIADGGAEESAIRLLADKFIVYKPDGTGAKQVFTLGTVNGQTTLILLGDLLADGSVVARHVSAGSITADKLSVTILSAITANLGTVTAGRVRSPDNDVDINLDSGYMRVLDNAGSERVKLGLLSTGKYGLRVRDPATAKTATITPDVGIIVASGSLTMPTTLNADSTYEVAIALGKTYSFADLTVIVEADDVPAYNIGGRYGTVNGSVVGMWGELSSGATYKERDGNNTSGRPKYKSNTVSIGAGLNAIVSTYLVTRWNKGSASSGSTIYLQGSKNLQVYDRIDGTVKNLIEIGWPIEITYTVIAKNYQG